MSLSDGDRAEIKVMAIEAAERIIEKVIEGHIASCPIGKTLNVKLAFAGGISTGIAIVATIIGIMAYFR